MITYQTFLDSISFRLLKQHTPPPRLLRTLRARFPRAHHLFEVLNTRVGGAGTLRKALWPLCQLPRMSTFAIGAIINRGVAAMPPGQAFVNVGVWNGFTLLAGMIDNPDKVCIGIDNFSEFGGPRDAFLRQFETYRSPNHRFFEMDYAAYFREHHQGRIGFYIYDGNHSYDSQRRGLEVAEPHLAPGALILVDDTNTVEPRQATLDFMARSTCSYEVLLDQQTCANQHPTFWNGIILLRKMS